jgi:hypothetical protein
MFERNWRAPKQQNCERNRLSTEKIGIVRDDAIKISYRYNSKKYICAYKSQHRSTHCENLRYEERKIEQYPSAETEYLETICWYEKKKRKRKERKKEKYQMSEIGGNALGSNERGRKEER